MADARKLSTQELFRLRKRFIRLYKKQMPVMQIAQECESSWDAVNVAIKLYEKGGVEGLKPKSRGRKQGTGRILTPDQEKLIKNALYTKKPYQVGLKDPDCENMQTLYLWSFDRVRQYIHQKHGVQLSRPCLARYLNRWGLWEKPKKHPPVEYCSPEIQNWLKKNSAWEKDIDSAYWIVRKTIIVDGESGSSRKQKLSVLMAINGKKNREDFWSVYKGIFTKKRQIGFLKFMFLQSDRKILTAVRTCVDHFTHERIKRFVETYSHRIAVIPPILPLEKKELAYRKQANEDAKMLRTMRS